MEISKTDDEGNKSQPTWYAARHVKSPDGTRYVEGRRLILISPSPLPSTCLGVGKAIGWFFSPVSASVPCSYAWMLATPLLRRWNYANHSPSLHYSNTNAQNVGDRWKHSTDILWRRLFEFVGPYISQELLWIITRCVCAFRGRRGLVDKHVRSLAKGEGDPRLFITHIDVAVVTYELHLSPPVFLFPTGTFIPHTLPYFSPSFCPHSLSSYTSDVFRRRVELLFHG